MHSQAWTAALESFEGDLMRRAVAARTRRAYAIDLGAGPVLLLAMFGGSESHKMLAEVYASTSDPSIKRSILRAYMIGGDREHLFEAAKVSPGPPHRVVQPRCCATLKITAGPAFTMPTKITANRTAGSVRCCSSSARRR